MAYQTPGKTRETLNVPRIFEKQEKKKLIIIIVFKICPNTLGGDS